MTLLQDAHDSNVEELEATLQELDDLQRSVCELTSDNEKLTDERTILLESLCTQTEKLEHARLQVEVGLLRVNVTFHAMLMSRYMMNSVLFMTM